MSLALFRKTAFDHRWILALVALGAVCFPVLLVHVFASIPWDMMQPWLELPPIAAIIRTLAGAELTEALGITALGGFAFVHPAMLALGWVCAVAAATRVIAGEVDQGTADVLLALPYSRWRTYTTLSLWVFLCCPIIVVCTWLGVFLGNATAPLPEAIDLWQLRHVAANDCAMLWAVAGIAMLFSAGGSRRGRAMGGVFAVLVISFLINTLAGLRPWTRGLAVIGILHYFRPFEIVRRGRLIMGDVIVLLSLALVTWIIGGIIFARRDIHSS